jgi:hypothetical protein
MALLSVLVVSAYFVFLAPQLVEASFISAIADMFRRADTAAVSEY